MKEVQLKLKIPTSLLNAGFRQKELESEFMQRLALSYYSDGILSFGQAARMVDMTLWEFADLIARKKVWHNYELEDIENEVKLGKELGLI
jgi:predicted HTH domain antitoxin